MSKTRLDKLGKAIKVLQQQRQVVGQRSVADGTKLPLIEVGGEDGSLPLSYYTLTGHEWLNVSDVLLAVGGPTAWAAAQLSTWDGRRPASQREQEVVGALTGLGFEQADDDPKLWRLPTPEAEQRFLADWLAQADASGREVKDRVSIESKIKHLGGS